MIHQMIILLIHLFYKLLKKKKKVNLANFSSLKLNNPKSEGV